MMHLSEDGDGLHLEADVPWPDEEAGPFVVSAQLRDALFELLRQNFEAMDRWEAFHFGPPGKLTRRARLRWWRTEHRERLAIWVFNRISPYPYRED